MKLEDYGARTGDQLLEYLRTQGPENRAKADRFLWAKYGTVEYKNLPPPGVALKTIYPHVRMDFYEAISGDAGDEARRLGNRVLDILRHSSAMTH